MTTLNLKQKAELPSHPLPIVSIGLGGIVHDAHYPAYKKVGFPVVGGYDPNPERADFMRRAFDLPRLYSSLSEAIGQSPPDAIFDIAVPGSAVLDILRQLPDNRAVLIQKPMGETLEQARAILELCQSKKLTAAVNFQMRFAPYIIAARDMIAQGLIGDVNDIEVKMQVHMPWDLWSFLKHTPRLEILYHSIHYVDLLRSFLGNPRRVLAKTLKHPLTPDLAATRSNILLDYGDSVRATIMTNHGHIYGPDKQESYVKWEGSKGAIQTQVGLNMDYPKGRPDRFEYVFLGTDSPPKWQSIPIEGSWFPDAFIGTMSSLMRYVLGESDHLPTAVEDAFQTMQVVEAAYQSTDHDGTFI
jgi:predicted dehydrogenase